MSIKKVYLLAAVGMLIACAVLPSEQADQTPPPSPVFSPPPASAPPSAPAADAWLLWTNGAQLRGANIWQRIVVPELDGEELLGSGYIGPPYTQEDFDRLSALGANYVNLSHPGLFTERPPYVLDEEAQANLDRLLSFAAKADLFAVITFRTGPGRSDFTFYRDGAGVWFDPSLLIETLWTDQAAQDAWVEMWAYAAQRYRRYPQVAAYDLLCEPNANDVALGLYAPQEFYPQYAGSSYDWNQFYPRIVEGIRQVDTQKPILVSPMGWGSVPWLPYLQTADDPRIVYAMHQYEPQTGYTHQEPPAAHTYPGELDINGDGSPERFDRLWLQKFLSVIGDFKQAHGAPVAVNEFGVERWAPGAAQFMSDQMEIFEQYGANHALWVWDPDWAPWTEAITSGFNFRLGPDPENTTPVDNDLQDVILNFWARNTLRPSAFSP